MSSEDPKEEETGVAETQELNAVQQAFGAARSRIYDLAIVHVTSVWYEAMLEEMEEGSVVLDVGIGTASTYRSGEFLVFLGAGAKWSHLASLIFLFSRLDRTPKAPDEKEHSNYWR
jgi:hypothetical protein